MHQVPEHQAIDFTDPPALRLFQPTMLSRGAPEKLSFNKDAACEDDVVMKNTVVDVDEMHGCVVAQEDGTSLHFVLLVPEVRRFRLGDSITGDLRFLASMGSGVIGHGQDQCLVVCPKGTCSLDTAMGALTKH